MAYTAGQKVRAADLNTGLLAGIANNNVATTGLKVAFGTASGVFSASSFAQTNIGFSAAGFTANPVVFMMPADGGASGAITSAVGGITTTGAVLVPRTAGGANITGSIALVWVAIGV